MPKKRGLKPKAGASTSVSKTPVAGASTKPAEEGTQPISWRFGDADLGGKWSWGDASEAHLREIHKFLSDMESKTWAQAYSNTGMGVKQVRIADCPNTAVAARLEAIQRDDIEDLWEFHLGGKKRVWGIRRGPVCYLLWWDPTHDVWPSKKKHT